ncbi:unnamed protein product [Hapterophycus canaliculatus]
MYDGQPNGGPAPCLLASFLLSPSFCAPPRPPPRSKDASIVSSAVAYISFYLLGWSPMFWTAG